nr:SDR family oxidoreductase [Dactylosporangium thailandense]
MSSSKAVVTGAAGGIGKAVAARLAADGFDVHGVDRGDGDLTTEDGVAAALGGIGPVAALVHCAGVTTGAPVHETTLADWHHVLDTNVTSAFLCARAVLPGMIEQRHGVIITIGSIHATRHFPGLPAYSASKAALAAFTRQLAVDYRRYDIRAVTITPAWVRTPDTETRLTDPDDLARLAETQRLGTPGDIAAAVSYALSAPYLTGTELVLDGGASAAQTAALLRPGPRAKLGLPPLQEGSS